MSELALPEYKKFKEKVTKNHLVSIVDDLKELELAIFKNLPAIIKDNESKLEGWVPGHYQRDYEALRDKQGNVSDEIRQNSQDILKIAKRISTVKDDFIGPYTFDFVKERLENTVIPQEEFNKDLQEKIDSIKSLKMSQESIEKNIKSTEEQSKDQQKQVPNLLEYLKVNRQELVGPGLLITQRGLINKYYISELEQLNLAKEETIKNSTHWANGRVTDSRHDSLYFTDEGKKFMTMLDELSSAD